VSINSVLNSRKNSTPHRTAVLRREDKRQRWERLFGWRLSAYYRHLRVYYRRWRRRFSLIPWGPFADAPYAAWVREEESLLGSAADYTARIAALSPRPTVSILIAVYEPHLPWLEEGIRSVLAQFYPHWELWLCDVTSPVSTCSALKQYQDQDVRVKVVSFSSAADTAAALNRALQLASGEFIGLLAQHDTLAPHTLYEVVRRLQDDQADLLYSDEDTINAAGQRSAPFCKPDWSPDLCLSSLYACRFGVYRKHLVEAVGGFRPAYAQSLDYDLLLRCSERSERIVHVPQILYHKRTSRDAPPGRLYKRLGKRTTIRQFVDTAHESAKRAVSDALNRRAEMATVEDGSVPCTFRVRRRVSNSPLVSIIIPTRDRLSLLRRCLQSVETRTTYRHYEILVIDNGSREPQTLAYLASLPYQVIRDGGPFNFARLNNRAAALAHGRHLLFLNNDVEVITPEWLEALLEHSQRREVGAVGAQLLYADGTIQHAGIVLGVRGVAGHAHKYLPAESEGYFGFPHLIRNYSAVTAACLMLRKAVYEEAGGLDERLAVTFNDVDLCLRLRARGYLVVYTPYARLYHYESRSRWYQPPSAEEVRLMLDRWGTLLPCDPYYNPHLTLEREDFGFDLGRARSVLRDGMNEGR
jgi:O-antigen biosynthesis protein